MLVLPLSLALLASTGTASSGQSLRVLDGDSLRHDTGDIRLWGLDAPEWDQPGGEAATAHLRRLIATGGRITCKALYLDPHGRTVARCATQSGLDLACAQIKAGVAREYRRYSQGAYRRCTTPR